MIDGMLIMRDNVCHVKRALHSDITKLLLYLTLTLLAAAALAPWLFNAGKMFAEVTGQRASSAAMLWFAEKCASADFSRYFNRSLLICALLLAGPFIAWMRFSANPSSPRLRPWRVRIAPPASQDASQPLARNRRGLLHLGSGFFLTSGLTLLMVWLVLVTGWFGLTNVDSWKDILGKALVTALVVAAIEELVFRGMLLGILLRSLPTLPAILLSSLVFSVCHYLRPPSSFILVDPGNADAGFRFLTVLADYAMHPSEYLFGFITLFFAGAILAYARYRTASLWLPIGLHMGWITIAKVAHGITEPTQEHLHAASLLISENLRSGVLPICFLLTTGLLVHVFVELAQSRRLKQLDTP